MDDKFDDAQRVVESLERRKIKIPELSFSKKFSVRLKSCEKISGLGELLPTQKSAKEVLKDFFSYKSYKLHPYVHDRVELYSFEASLEETAELATILTEGIETVSYSRMCTENKQIPLAIFRELTSRTEPLHLVEDTGIFSKVANIPSVTPEIFEGVCKRFAGQQTVYSFFRDEVKNFFPYHPQPYAMATEYANFGLGMHITRGIFVTQKFNTHLNISVTTDKKENIEAMVGKVESAFRELFPPDSF
ncbi:hypothetical protein HY643_01380 [Candidatus Woesearchaeota archaeon]|nr:hypothetical protein [Candidatus Woesearchaeota archaeon]